MAILVNSIEVGNAGTDDSAAIITAEVDWTPSAPGEYTIQVQAFSTDGTSLSKAARVCVSAFASEPQISYVADCSSYRMPVLPIQPEFTFTPTKEPSITPKVPSLTPFVPSVTPLKTNVTMLKNAFCRKGPSVLYKDVTAVPKDEIVQAQGRNEDATWLYVYWKKFDVHCWIAGSTGIADSDIKSLPIQSAPPEPTIIDFDGDGYSPPVDCNDKNASIHPDALDSPKDGIDQNCNGDPDK
ncbi:MAG: putative metal-binding motif-containing protein [Chloroflexi bacterium]|nr:putative metal-binding motif-containing protein [Chloroflexota bacterium]